MKMRLLQLLSMISIFALPKQVVPADVAPPPAAAGALALGVLIVLGIIVAIVVVISILVIRAIRRKHTPKNDI